jgi:hypothetical protein
VVIAGGGGPVKIEKVDAKLKHNNITGVDDLHLFNIVHMAMQHFHYYFCTLKRVPQLRHPEIYTQILYDITKI